MKNEKEYKDLLKYAGEQVALEDFQQGGETHKFSGAYDEKMNALLAMEDNKESTDSKDNQKIVKFSKKKLVMAALVAVLALGTVAVTAATRGKVRFVMIPDVDNPKTGVLVGAETMTEDELSNHHVFVLQEDTLETRSIEINDDNIYIQIAINPETGELLDPNTLTVEERSKYYMMDFPEDAQYEDGTPVTKESLLSGKLPKGFEEDFVFWKDWENDIIDTEIFDKIKQANVYKNVELLEN